METAVKRMYEGMFLVDSALAAQDWQKILDEVQRILDRAEADVVSLKKWDERRLCYDVQGKSRGTYILVYFNCDTDKVKGIERDVQLSELITRVLVLRTDRMSKQDLERPTPLEAVPEPEKSDKPVGEAEAAPVAETASEEAAPAPEPEKSDEPVGEAEAAPVAETASEEAAPEPEPEKSDEPVGEAEAAPVVEAASEEAAPEAEAAPETVSEESAEPNEDK
ncbi:MAG: 30S ribosomal protein S6 [Planctomycetota bacterium]